MRRFGALEAMRRRVDVAAINQTRFGEPMGNCWEACVATLTGFSLSQIPDGRPDGERTSWEDVRAWLAGRGWLLLFFPVALTGGRLPIIAGVPYILSGRAPTGVLHSVVAVDGSTVHNPNPKPGTGLVDARSVEWLLPITDRGAGELATLQEAPI